LQQQLQHPAGAVRVSAVKGIQYVVSQAPVSQWLPLLSQLLSALGPTATVDEDPEVRQAGCAALKELVGKLGESKSLLIPFAPYLTALLTTALNALDVPQCHNGASMVEWLASVMDSESLTAAIPQFVPPLTMLLSDKGKVTVSNSSASLPTGSMRKSKNNNKKRKRGGSAQQQQQTNNNAASSSKAPKQSALRAIHALLQSTASSKSDASHGSALEYPDLTVAEGTCSAVIFSRKDRPQRVIHPIFSLDDFPCWNELGIVNKEDEEEGIHATRSHDHSKIGMLLQSSFSTESLLSPTETLDLLTRLRDCLVEASQNKNLGQVLICTATVRLLLESAHGAALLQHTAMAAQDLDQTHGKRLLKLCNQIAASVLDWFPLTTNAADEQNAELCTTLMRLAATVKLLPNISSSNNKNEVHLGITAIATHIQTCLEQDEEAMETDLETELVTSKSLLGVLEDILVTDELLQKSHGQLRTSLVELFCTVFFSPEKSIGSTKARSDTGRSAALLACHLLASCDYCIERAKEQYGVAVTDLLNGIPQYLAAWRADFVVETASCISLLQDVVRRVPGEGADNNNLRIALEPLLTTGDSKSSEDDDYETVSIFEQFPVELQRQVICFLTMLSSPTTTTVKALGEICARCHLKSVTKSPTSTTVSQTVASFIVQCIHCIRKSVPMQVYIGFLVDSTGLLRLDGSYAQDITPELIGAIDSGVGSMASCLIGCGTAKVLPMLENLLSVLLNKSTNNGAIDAAIQARAALSLIAMFSLDLSQYGKIDVSIFQYLPDDFGSIVTSCLSKLLVHCSMEVQTMQPWLCPLIALLASEKDLLIHVFGSLSSQLDGMDKAKQTRQLDLWLSILKNPQLLPALKRDAVELLTVAKKLDEGFKGDESLDRTTSRILAELQIATEKVQ